MKLPHLPAAALLNEPPLDKVHAEVFAVLDRTLRLSDEPFPLAFHALVEGIEEDFRSEEALMERFPCQDVKLHREQHARMLAGLHHASAALLGGDRAPAERALAALSDWLPFHIATQDRHLVRILREHATAGTAPSS